MRKGTVILIIIGITIVILGINGDPAEEVIRDWYTNKLPD